MCLRHVYPLLCTPVDCIAFEMHKRMMQPFSCCLTGLSHNTNHLLNDLYIASIKYISLLCVVLKSIQAYHINGIIDESNIW